MKTIIVTGASSGLGKATCEIFAKDGAIVCAIARNKEKLKELEEAYPDNIFAYPADVSKGEDVKKVFTEILEKYDNIDLLVNNAGVVHIGDFDKQGFEIIDQTIDINLKGTMYCTQMIIPRMMEAKTGDIINVASVAATRPSPKAALYSASKHGMLGFSESIANDLRPKGIRVTTLCPGGIKTPIWTEQNEHPAGADDLMEPKDVVELMKHIINQPKNILYKKVVFFPVCEWA